MDRLPNRGDEVQIDPSVKWTQAWKKYSGNSFIVDEIIDRPNGKMMVSPFRLGMGSKGGYEGFAVYSINDLVLIKANENPDKEVKQSSAIEKVLNGMTRLFLLAFVPVWMYAIIKFHSYAIIVVIMLIFLYFNLRSVMLYGRKQGA